MASAIKKKRDRENLGKYDQKQDKYQYFEKEKQKIINSIYTSSHL